MAYNFPTQGGLKATYNGQTIGIWMADTGGVGWILITARQDPSGWTAFWNYGPAMPADMIAEITGAGGMAAWLAKFIDKINAAIQALFGAAPPPGTQINIDNINLTLANSFTLTVGPAGPVLAKK